MVRVVNVAYLGACCLLFFAVSAVAMIPPAQESGSGNRARPHSAGPVDRAAASTPDRTTVRPSSRRTLSLEPELAGFALP